MNQKLIDLTVWLRANPVPNLNLQKWCSVDDSGTASYCIIGWVAKNKMFGFYLNGINLPRHNTYHNTGSWSAIWLGLSISAPTALQLFGTDSIKGLTFDQIVNRIEAAGKSEAPAPLQIIL
jgi:hypothetical protein